MLARVSDMDIHWRPVDLDHDPEAMKFAKKVFCFHTLHHDLELLTVNFLFKEKRKCIWL
jgi:hypothetical protein